MATKNDKPKSNLPVKWGEEMARQAQIAAGMEDSTATGQFFSARGGVLSWNDSPMPNNQMAVIIIDSILENVLYTGKFDPEQPQAPECFAFGRNDAEMQPHEVVCKAGTSQCDTCKECKWNEWGTSDVGRGKACRNTRRLAMIPAGTLDANGKLTLFEEEAYKTASIGFMKLPVTSVKGYASLIKQVAGVLKRPPHGVIFKVKVVPDPKNQFKVVFETLMAVPDELIPIIMQRHEEAMAVIDFPYTPMEERAPAPAQQPQRLNRGKAAQPRGRKY